MKVASAERDTVSADARAVRYRNGGRLPGDSGERYR